MTTATTPGVAFLTVPNLVTCSEVTIEWTYNATLPPTSVYPLVVTNIGVEQSGLHLREYPLVSRQSTAVVNTTLAAVNASTGRFDWPKVNIPQGWYRMNIYATAGIIPSNVFNVTNGLDVSCVVTPLQSSLPPSSSTLPLTPASTDTPSSTNSPSVTTTPVVMAVSHVKRNAIIAGTVTGGIVLFAVAVLCLYRWYHRRKTRIRNPSPATGPRNKGQQPRREHHKSDSSGAILSFDKEHPRHLSMSEEDSDLEKFYLADRRFLQNPPLTAPQRPRSTRIEPMVAAASFDSYDSDQPRPSTSPSPSHNSSPRTRRTSRKPVPVYDPKEFPPESNGAPLSGLPGTTVDRKPTFLLVPDLPKRRG